MMKKVSIVFGFVLVIVIAVLTSRGTMVSAQTIWNVPGDFNSIQEAIDAASDGDEILVASGTYQESLTINKDVHLRSADGPDSTIVETAGNGRVLTVIEGGTTSSATIEGFTIRGGTVSTEGGRPLLTGTSATILGNIIEDNVACDGAGIAVVGGSPRIEGNIIRYNYRKGCTGGSGGGGIYLRTAGSAVVIKNVIENNTITGGPGGGVSLNAAGSTLILNNIIRFNDSTTSGGGLYIRNASNPDLVQNLVYGNTSTNGGGIDWLVPYGQRGPYLLSNTFAENEASQGSGVRADGYDGGVILENNVLIGKTYPAVYCHDGYGDVPPVFRYNNAYTEGTIAYDGSCGAPTGSDGNISAAPLFVDAVGQDFHMYYGSPSIDSGDDNINGLPGNDLDGRNRVLDGDGDGSAVVDMGVYEAPVPLLDDLIIGEVGFIDDALTHTEKTIVLNHSFDEPVVFAKPVSYDGSDESLVRITDVQSDRFTLFVDEAPNKDGNHTTESVSYLVLEAGKWELEDGTHLEVGLETTTAVVGRYFSNTWKAVSFESPFSSTPVVLTQIQTNNDPGWAGTRQVNASSSGVQFAIEAEESAKTNHGPETVGWLAIEAGPGTWEGMLFEAGHTPDDVTHRWYSVGFTQSYSTAPRFLASLATYDGGDSSHLRYRNLTGGSVQVMVEEDTTNDREKNHTREVVDYLAIAADGLLSVPGDFLQPTPVPSPTPRTPQPTSTPLPTNTPLPTATWTPTIAVPTYTPTKTATATSTITVPTYTPGPTDTMTPSPELSCDLIEVDYHSVTSPSYIFVRIHNDNPVEAYLTKSYIEWPMHEIYYLDWLYFGGYYYNGDDPESPNETILETPRTLMPGSYSYWYAGFAVSPDAWAAGHWTIELTFGQDCGIHYEFDHLVPTGTPVVIWTGTPPTTPTSTPEPTKGSGT
jgi:hypothetical protein